MGRFSVQSLLIQLSRQLRDHSISGHLTISLKLKKIINQHVGLLVGLEFFLRHTDLSSGVNQLCPIYLKLLLVYLL